MRRTAFTLVELMITVGVVGALAAVAVPGWMNLTYRAKRAELPPNVDGIRTAEMSYRSTFDLVVTTGYARANASTNHLELLTAKSLHLRSAPAV